MVRKRIGEQGFTLLEMLVAISLLLIGIFAVISMQITAIKSDAIANRISASSLLAQRAMEELLSRSNTDPVFTTAVTNAAYPNSPTTVQGAGRFATQYSTVLNPVVAGSSTSGLVQITVTVSLVGSTLPPVTVTAYKRVT